jgi:hypothetical protein
MVSPVDKRVQRRLDELTAMVRVLADQYKQLERATTLMEAMVARQKQEDKWRRRVRRQLDALMRSRYVGDSRFSPPANVVSRRFVLHSQNEEDGITLALLDMTGVVGRRFVEIGCGAKGGNSAILAFEFGWSGVMIDANPVHLEGLRRQLLPNRAVSLACATVSSRNVNTVLREHGVSGEIDLLSIDVDSCDYWVFDALDACTPRVVVIEYNALFGPDRAVTLPDQPLPVSIPKGYFGASLAALEKVARRKGYRLVVCEPSGMNAFFVRNDLAPELPGLTPAEAFRVAVDRRSLVDPQPVDIDIYRRIAEEGLPLVDV